jgi:hypothetical protein
MAELRLRGRGHPSIRATHANTFELTPDADIGSAATCVVGVGYLPVPSAAAIAGAVRLELTVGPHSVTVHAVGNPRWVPGGPAVVRRSGVRLPNTLATDADLASSDLPRDLVTALADPAASVELTVTPVPGPATVVLLWASQVCPPGCGCRLSVEAPAATLVLAEDDGAAQLLRAHGVTPSAPGAAGSPPPPLVAAVDGRPVGAGGEVGRVLVVATEDLPGRSVPELLGRTDVAVEVVGLPGAAAVAAASASRAPVVLATDGHDAGRLLRSTPAGHRLVVSCAATALPRLVRAVRQHRGGAGILLARTPYSRHERPIRYHDGLALTGDVVCCVEPGRASDGLDAAEVRLAETLLADGVPTRTVARALAELTGRSRRETYQAVLHLTATPT